MKKKIIYLFMGVMTLSLTLPSCKKYLDINDNPNTAEVVDPKLLFSFATTSYINLRSSGDSWIPFALAGQSVSSGGNSSGGLSWGSGGEDQYVFSSFIIGNPWRAYYTRMNGNLSQAISLAESASPKNNNAAAQCKVLLALSFYELTTIYGDVPYSEALKVEISYPKFDSQKDVLQGVISLLDNATAQFDEASPLKISDYDLFYKGDIAKWKRLAKSLRLRTLMTMVDKDPSKATEIGQMIAAGGFANSSADNFLVFYQNITGKKNPKYAISEQYNAGLSFFYGSPYVVDFMKGINDPRLKLFFAKAAAANDYYGVPPGEDADDDLHSKISPFIHSAAAPEVIFTYQEQLFYEAEIQARGLGVPVNLAAANTLYKQAITESCKFYSVAGADAATFSAGLVDLSAEASPIKAIHMHHWVDKMDRGIDAFTQWRRSGPEGDEVPALTLPSGAPAGGLFRRFPYPITNEISVNPNAPKTPVLFTEKLWFDL